jgi:hypothetical protein
VKPVHVIADVIIDSIGVIDEASMVRNDAHNLYANTDPKSS